MDSVEGSACPSWNVGDDEDGGAEAEGEECERVDGDSADCASASPDAALSICASERESVRKLLEGGGGLPE